MKKKPGKAKQRLRRSIVDTPAKKFVFWSTDEWPYVLGGVGLLEDNGFARIPGHGMYVQPVRVFDVPTGEALALALGKLKAEHETVLNLVRQGFSARLAQIAPWARPKMSQKSKSSQP